MAPERKKRARTKPIKAPKEKRLPLPPLPPIPPSPNAEKPKPRERGRPKVEKEEHVLLPCPFAAAGRQNPCITYPDPVEKGRVNNPHE